MNTAKSSKAKTCAAAGSNGTRRGSQTLLRGLDVLETASRGVVDITQIADRLGLTKSTAHRLASSLVERRFLSFAPRKGYWLGPKLLELGECARQQIDLARVVRPHLEGLSLQTGHTVHLGILRGSNAIYLDKIQGRARIEVCSRVGEVLRLTSTGLGKALILDQDEAIWRELWMSEHPSDRNGNGFAAWLTRMRTYAANGYAFDLEENEDRIRCVAAPVRDASRSIVASISLTSAAVYLDTKRMHELAKIVKSAANNASDDLGWMGK